MHGSCKLVKPESGINNDPSNLFRKVCSLKNMQIYNPNYLLLEDKQQFQFGGSDDKLPYIIFSIFFSHVLTQIREV